MATYDIVMLCVVLFAAFLGWQKGMAWQLASLAAIGVSFVVAMNFSNQLAPHINIEDPFMQWAAASAVLYLGTALAIWMMFRVVRTSIEQMKLKDFDRQMGALLGAAKGVVLVCVITVLIVGFLGDQQRITILKSRSGHYVHYLVHLARPILPEQVNRFFGDSLDDFEEHMHNPNIVPNFASQTQGFGVQNPPSQNQVLGGQIYPSQAPDTGAQTNQPPRRYLPPQNQRQPAAGGYNNARGYSDQSLR